LKLFEKKSKIRNNSPLKEELKFSAENKQVETIKIRWKSKRNSISKDLGEQLWTPNESAVTNP